ncbi:hypothetical protein BcepSauron_183 [Burkholderia phage BcepSauron]|uniref:Uncharacterized protein n=2 Tax=Sarumanvirus TaxID=2843450 RepID=A0A482MN22_9CAUD|nr:hypothetical protein H1O16_gp185 [Burkholderia phage BcepSaruman]YP_009904561.1 hypothetical protein H1O17_gp183 [Burkholderia phage BcepSauron]QBQ74563.1 hypothetical protein BcepSauron_183 [Burkholderia phage BcepSauron]QBX06598.1 hypothetical protein BcepSaruman_185 [Burkholderia phage BcepSaruman]
MNHATSRRAQELGDQLHKVQRKIRDMRQELAELEAQSAIFARRLEAELGGETSHFDSAEGYVKVVEFDYEADPEDVNDLDIPAMRDMIRAARRRVPVLKRTKVVVRYARNDESLD